jgi:hypothetical protein
MRHVQVMSLHRRLSGAVWVLVATATCGLVAACNHGSAGTPTPIVLRPHFTHFSGSLSGGLHVSGTLYPSIPQYSRRVPVNTISLLITRRHSRVHHGWIGVTSRMIDMVMVPIRGRVNSSGGRFTGKLDIPMFGSYRVELSLHLGGRIHRGSVVVPVLIPHV